MRTGREDWGVVRCEGDGVDCRQPARELQECEAGGDKIYLNLK